MIAAAAAATSASASAATTLSRLCALAPVLPLSFTPVYNGGGGRCLRSGPSGRSPLLPPPMLCWRCATAAATAAANATARQSDLNLPNFPETSAAQSAP